MFRRREFRERSPLLRRLPNDFDLRTYQSLPERLNGYGRVTYYGTSCSLLKDLDTRTMVFFFNASIYAQVNRDRKRFGVDRIVYFEAERSMARSNLRTYYDAKRVDILDEYKEDQLQLKWRRDGYGDRRSLSSNGSSNRENYSENRRRSSSKSGHRRRYSTDDSSSTSSSRSYKRRKTDFTSRDSDTETETEKEKKKKKDDDDEKFESKSYEIDRSSFVDTADKIDKVRFDRIEMARLNDAEKEGVKNKGDFGSTTKKSDDQLNDLDEFMNYEENFAEQFEFAADENAA